MSVPVAPSNALALTAVLRKVPLFAQMDETGLEQIARRMRRRRLPAGEALFHEGDPGQTLYIVLEGRVRISKIAPSGQTIYLAQRRAGEHFGEMALIDGKPRSADAFTVSECDLLMLDRPEFVQCIETSPQVGLQVMAALAERLREASDRQEALQEQDVGGRLAEALLEMADIHGVREKTGAIRINARVTHQQIAEQIGATRESVSRALSLLRETGILDADGRTLIIRDRARLKRRAAR